MIRKHLSLQLALVLLLVSLVPLVGVGLITLHLIERSITDQVRAHHERLATASAALVQDYLKDALTKLKSVGRMINPDADPQAETRRLKPLVDPAGIFLEISYVEGKENPRVKVQVQQEEFNRQYFSNNVGEFKSQNRAFDPGLGQYVYKLSNEAPILAAPRKGLEFVAEHPEDNWGLPSLALSIPAGRGQDVLIGNLDFRPITDMLSTVAGSRDRSIILCDRYVNVLTYSSDPTALADYIQTRQPVGHGGWSIAVRESRDLALAPVRQARLQAALWFGLASVMAIGLAALFGSRLLRPLRALAGTADRLGRGDFSARSGVSRPDEIGQLAQAFDRMAGALQELDRMKDEFVAHVSHELRTPLTSAKIALANVEEGIAGKESLARVRDDLDRLIRMVNELLDLARIEAGIPLARQSTNLGGLVASAVETLRPAARVPLTVEGAGDSVEIDRARVHQIVVNLVDNALKYARSRVDVAVRGRQVRVTDDGPGVPPDQRERIFEKFARVESGAKPAGAGLGLSIARKLAELHGGSLTCEGNTFILSL